MDDENRHLCYWKTITDDYRHPNYGESLMVRGHRDGRFHFSNRCSGGCYVNFCPICGEPAPNQYLGPEVQINVQETEEYWRVNTH